MTLPKKPAFPIVAFDEDGDPYIDSDMKGLTKREYFAAMAMASDDYVAPFKEAYEERAKLWVSKADYLIKQLNKTENDE